MVTPKWNVVLGTGHVEAKLRVLHKFNPAASVNAIDNALQNSFLHQIEADRVLVNHDARPRPGVMWKRPERMDTIV